jgi:GNAT superfamily N-acetyltransferase
MAAIPLEKQNMNIIHALDFKTNHFALDADIYKKLLKEGTAVSTIASIEDKHVGFAVWGRGPKGKPAYFIRFGVLPEFRRRGIGRKLMQWVVADLQEARKKSVVSVLSQAVCMGKNDPDDVSGFMEKVGFTWVEAIPEAFHEYNQHFDGFKFERKL